VGKLERKRSFGSSGHRMRIILIRIFRKWDGEGMDWISLAKDRGRLYQVP
jgi:hypothetical protein